AAVIGMSVGWARAVMGWGRSALGAALPAEVVVRRVSQAAALAITAPPAPAVRKSAQSRSVGWNVRQLRRTTSATSVWAKRGLVSSRISSVLSRGGGDGAAGG